MRISKSTLASLVVGAALPLSALSAVVTQPAPKHTVAPQLSSEIAEASGEVRVLVRINEYGYVTDAAVETSTNEALNRSALDAIRDWSFVPATEDGQPIASKAIQPFHFNDGAIVLSDKAAGDAHPRASRRIAPQLDERLEHITGKVVLQASLDAAGHVTDVQARSSSHQELVEPAAAALKGWSFEPATKAGQPVASKVIVPFHFQGAGAFADIAATASESKDVDRAPVPVRRATRDLAKAIGSARGEAKLLLVIDENGYVVETQTLETTSDELAAIAREAALQWSFKPAIKDGVAVASKVVQPFSFNGGLVLPDAPVDSVPVALARKSPELPKSMTDVTGYVQVRLQLDERGNVLSASSLNSSHSELEQPTLQAAQGWKFKPAKREGQDVSSAVIIPFLFNQKS